jgi:hypothetical protein
MITAHVNKMAVVLRFAPADNLSHGKWEALLDELKSHYIPSFYQYGKRSHADFGESGKTRVVIYFTPKTVTLDEAIVILKKWNIRCLTFGRILLAYERVFSNAAGCFSPSAEPSPSDALELRTNNRVSSLLSRKRPKKADLRAIVLDPRSEDCYEQPMAVCSPEFHVSQRLEVLHVRDQRKGKFR